MDKFVNAEAFKRKLIDEKNFFPAIVARALEEMPAADVVKVPCKCSQCKYSLEGKDWINRTVYTCSKHNIVGLSADDYCSCGDEK